VQPLASIGRRFLALVIDCVILFVASKVVKFIPIVGQVPAVMLVVFAGYFSWMEASKYRGSLGKIAMGIEVGDLDGRPINWKTALVRNVMKIISWAIMFIGFLFAFFSERKQTLHDLVAKTLVFQSADLTGEE
jgi:uncharacterized RDD family membrane protein YckC